MGKNFDYDYIVIGSGPAGRTAAANLARAKKSVAIVEKSAFGGAELNTRDLPYKLNLDFALSLHRFSTAPALSHSSCHFNLPTLLSSNHAAISRAKERHATILASLNVKYHTGFAHFLDPHAIAVGERRLTAKNFILATGAELKATEIAGLSTTEFLTPADVFKFPRLPKFVLVVGGGPTGVQIAEYFAMLGSGVIIIERAATLLPREDEEVGVFFKNYLENNLDVTVITNARLTSIADDFTSKLAIFTSGTTEKMVRVDAVVLATGSAPTLDYGLENAGVDYKRTGIIVNKYFETTAKHIFAIGDSIDAKNSSTTRSVLEANALTENLLHRQKTPASYTGLIRSVNLSPAVATIGLNETDAISRDLKYKKSLVSLDSIPSILSDYDRRGFIKVLTTPSHRLLGATIVSNHADLIAEEFSLALTRHLDLNSLASIPRPLGTPAAAISTVINSLLTK